MRLSACIGFLAVFFFLSHAEGAELVFASYNVENYLSMSRYEDGHMVANAPKPDEEKDAVVQVLVTIHPDVVGLMEMGDSSMLDDLQARLKQAGLDFPYREWVLGADKERHLALLSRFPIADKNSQDDVPFEMDGKLERMPRGILDVTIAVSPQCQLRLVGAHLKSKLPSPDYNEDNLRAAEALQLRQHVDGILANTPDAKVLVFGDFNDTKNDYPIRELIGSPTRSGSLRDIWVKDRRGETWTEYWKAADVYSRIDYLLVSPALSKDVIAEKCGINDSPFWKTASDHRAIFATFALPDHP